MSLRLYNPVFRSAWDWSFIQAPVPNTPVEAVFTLPDNKEVSVFIDTITADNYRINFTIDGIDWEDIIVQIPDLYYVPLLTTLSKIIIEWSKIVTPVSAYYSTNVEDKIDREVFGRVFAGEVSKSIAAPALDIDKGTDLIIYRLTW